MVNGQLQLLLVLAETLLQCKWLGGSEGKVVHQLWDLTLNGAKEVISWSQTRRDTTRRKLTSIYLSICLSVCLSDCWKNREWRFQFCSSFFITHNSRIIEHTQMFYITNEFSTIGDAPSLVWSCMWLMTGELQPQIRITVSFAHVICWLFQVQLKNYGHLKSINPTESKSTVVRSENRCGAHLCMQLNNYSTIGHVLLLVFTVTVWKPRLSNANNGLLSNMSFCIYIFSEKHNKYLLLPLLLHVSYLTPIR